MITFPCESNTISYISSSFIEPPAADQFEFVPRLIPIAFNASNCDSVNSESSIIFELTITSPSLSEIGVELEIAGMIESMKQARIPRAIVRRMTWRSADPSSSQRPYGALSNEWWTGNNCSNFFAWRCDNHHLITRANTCDVTHSNSGSFQ